MTNNIKGEQGPQYQLTVGSEQLAYDRMTNILGDWLNEYGLLQGVRNHGMEYIAYVLFCPFADVDEPYSERCFDIDYRGRWDSLSDAANYITAAFASEAHPDWPQDQGARRSSPNSADDEDGGRTLDFWVFQDKTQVYVFERFPYKSEQ